MDTKASGIKEICIGGRFKQMNSACSVWERRGSLGLEKHEEHRAGPPFSRESNGLLFRGHPSFKIDKRL
jgi:hypothetical protein